MPRCLKNSFADGGFVRRLCTAALLLAVSYSPLHAATAPAFPGAKGQGAQATGGRGGDVYHVTSLEDYHPKRDAKIEGTLRHAIRSAEGPRTIVFDVGGAIALKAPLEIHKSQLTIAGQTAPAPGVTLWGYPLEISDCSDVAIRYLRVRLGDFHAREWPGMKERRFKGNNDLDPQSANAIAVGDCERVILDHVSACWGMDEVCSVTHARDVTVQHCIIAAALDDSYHPKGEHGYGSLIRGELTREDQQANRGGYTLWGNLWAHNRARNPSIGGQQKLDRGQTEADRRRTDVNLVNNVVYDWLSMPSHRSEMGSVRVNLIGNYYICGPMKKATRIFRGDKKSPTEIFVAGNFLDAARNGRHDGQAVGGNDPLATGALDHLDGKDRIVAEGAGEPFDFLGTSSDAVVSAEEAYQQAVARVGCSLTRDAVDARLIEELSSGGGQVINSQEELRGKDGVLAGIDDVKATSRPQDFDADADGMADDFERTRGLDPSDASDGNGTQLSGGGSTNLEVYLHEATKAR